MSRMVHDTSALGWWCRGGHSFQSKHQEIERLTNDDDAAARSDFERERSKATLPLRRPDPEKPPVNCRQRRSTTGWTQLLRKALIKTS